MFDKIGNRQPEGSISHGVHIYTEEGMHYERMADDMTLIIAADHEDVGQVTYYRLTAADWNGIVDGSQGKVTETTGEDLYLKE